MERITVEALRDPNAPEPPRAAGDWPGAAAPLTAAEAQTLCAVTETLCPHDWAEIALYRDTTVAIARTIAADADALSLLRDGFARLDQVFPLPFAGLSAGNRTKALATLEGSPFFRLCLRLTTRFFYDLPEVWSACGYEGVRGAGDGIIRTDIDGEVRA